MDIFKYFTKYGNKDYIGEEVSQIEHMTQAAMLAEKDGHNDYMILACLFHDIGHLIQIECNEENKMGKYGLLRHEKIGKQYLIDNNMPYPIPQLVENHVKAKRYLTFKYPEYVNKLSEASVKTLGYQGGIMSQQEAEDFENDPLFDLSLKLRDYDDKSKIKNLKIKNLDYYKNKLSKLLVK